MLCISNCFSCDFSFASDYFHSFFSILFNCCTFLDSRVSLESLFRGSATLILKLLLLTSVLAYVWTRFSGSAACLVLALMILKKIWAILWRVCLRPSTYLGMFSYGGRALVSYLKLVIHKVKCRLISGAPYPPLSTHTRVVHMSIVRDRWEDNCVENTVPLSQLAAMFQIRAFCWIRTWIHVEVFLWQKICLPKPWEGHSGSRRSLHLNRELFKYEIF